MAVVGSALAVLCAHYDLALSLAWVDPQAAWAQFVDRYGELPGFYVIAAAFLATFLRANSESVRARIARAGLCLASALALTVALAVSYYRGIGAIPPTASIVATLTLVVVLFAFAHGRVGRTWTELAGVRRAASTTLWLALASTLFVHPLKLVWGRVRFRDLDAAHLAFSEWYLPQGLTGHSSFPSGHTAMAWMLLPCVLLFARGTSARRITSLVVVSWGCFVALGRVVIGAHYSSDVVVATLFAFCVVAWARGVEAPSAAR
jgi:membrane-associated phospholipid phosphatase